ncbi:c-type cytochrome [Leisingera aquimarina]|uniref:c-type cytochrome n=1 Tax=Leisingera aquimarina TaxID=476529 RepID=UPI000412B95A|nr:cytochrome c family protein [Leisingera aquimarina]
MLNSLFRGVSVAALIFAGQSALSADWVLDGASSKLAFGSVKKDTVGEVHSFEELTGNVSKDGTVTVAISLPSVETFIDIRNERMIDHVFNGEPQATLTAKVDIAALEALPAGGTLVADVEGKLSLLRRDIPVETEMFVARLSDQKVMVTTNDLLFLGVEDAGLTKGVDILQELAKLSGITRTVPVTARFVFEAGSNTAQTAPAAQETEVALSGDPAKGKKVFRKCQACHSFEEGKNGAGPSLHGIMGTGSAAAYGFKYSSAFKDANLTWSEGQLAAFLTDPKSVVPGNRMGFRGLKKDDDVQNVIAYIRQES